MHRETLEAPVRIVRLEGDDLHGAAERIGSLCGLFAANMPAAPASFPWSADFAACGDLEFLSARFGGEWLVRPVRDAPERLLIVRPRAGSVAVDVGGTIHEAGPGALLLAGSTQMRGLFHRGEPNAADILFIDRPAVVRAAAAFGRPVLGPIGLQPLLDPARPAGRTILELVDLLCAGMRPDGPLLGSPLALAHLTQSLVCLILDNVANTVSRRVEAGALAPRQVRRAIEFMRENIDRPITAERMAQVVGVSSRSLQAAFKAFEGVTPSVYLRGIRLEAARNDLLDPDMRLSTREICLKWGFFHLGRFSDTYRKAYGEMPSETRARMEGGGHKEA